MPYKEAAFREFQIGEAQHASVVEMWVIRGKVSMEVKVTDWIGGAVTKAGKA